MMPSSQDRPIVTFALFAYNQEQYIREAVLGAFSQTYEPLEIILSDDCSSDRTFEIMQEMSAAYKGPHTVLLRQNKANLGLAGHINYVLADVTGSIVSWAAGDDIALPHRTEALVHEILLSSKITAAHSAVLEIDNAGNELGVRKHSFDTKNIGIDAVLRSGCSVVTQSMAFRKEIFDLFGPFRDDLTHEGKAMAFRLVTSGKVTYVNQSLTKYRMGSGISTYSGSDIERIKNSEPLKVNRWYLSSYIQMLDDSEKLHKPLNGSHRKLLDKQIHFYRNLERINNSSAYVWPIIHNFKLRPFNTITIRAALRKVMPISSYRLILRQFLRSK